MRIVRLGATLLVCLLLAPAGIDAAGVVLGDGPAVDDGNTSLGPGTVRDPANGTTVISTQGYTFDGRTNPKKPARLVAVGERGELQWTHEPEQGAWLFDVDPLPNSNLLVVSPRAGQTLVYEFDPDSQSREWERLLPYEDTHDIDMLDETTLAVSHMRAWNESREVSNDGILIYDLETDRVTWRWRYRDHFPDDTAGGMRADWTHSNDVDPVGDEQLLVSPRNFDQVLLINRTTKEIDMRLGSVGDHEVVNEQHNPDYLRGENGTPTLLVADSGNNRVVEYAHTNGTWTRTWEVGTGTLNWPRDADRLPNGNTLITDTLNHRVIEVTPTGEVVWEYHATWGPYDSERVAHGDGSTGPTIREQDATGTYTITGTSADEEGRTGVRRFLVTVTAGTPLAERGNEAAVTWGHYAPWVRPVWLGDWSLFWALCAGVVTLGWVVFEVGSVASRRVGG